MYMQTGEKFFTPDAPHPIWLLGLDPQWVIFFFNNRTHVCSK